MSADAGEPDADARVRADIDRFGWHVALIPPDPEEPAGSTGWAFTIGLHERFAHPEIVSFGREVAILHPLLNRAGDAVRRGARLVAGAPVDGLLQGFACAVREVDARWVPVFLGNAQWHYRSDPPVLQLFWPDPEGRFPWDPAFAAAWRADQPLLYEGELDVALPGPLRESLRREGAL